MNYLADANVLSEATRPVPETRVLAWIERHESDLLLSAVTVGELRQGSLCIRRAANARRLASRE
jgi:predicted nucleic acid-binding protein